jgi:hypothetical protein
MELQINNKKYKLINNLGYCKNCQTINESSYDWVIIECSCSSCFVSGGTSYKARVYGVHAVNVSKWLDVDSGTIVTYNELCCLRQS